MPIRIDSTTDSKEAVITALGDLAPKKELEETEDEVLDDSDSASEEGEETADDSDTSDSEEDSEEEIEQDKKVKAKKPGGFQKRIKKLSSKLSAKDQEIDYWRDQALKAQKAAPQSNDATKVLQKNDKPSADEFESHDEYIDALTDWKVEKKLEAHEAKQRQEAVKNNVQKRISTHNERVKSFAESVDDFQDVMEEVDDIILPLAVQEILIESEQGPQLMYELAKNRDELERICKMTPLKAALSIGAFESKIKVTKLNGNQKNLKITKAPPPLTPIRGRSDKAIKKSIYDSELSFKEFEALRLKQLSQR